MLFEYEAASKGELSIIEDEILKVFDYEEQWILVKTDRDGGRVGYVPESYVEEVWVPDHLGLLSFNHHFSSMAKIILLKRIFLT